MSSMHLFFRVVLVLFNLSEYGASAIDVESYADGARYVSAKDLFGHLMACLAAPGGVSLNHEPPN